ncbi:guanylyl cyclase C-like [Lampetra fluviatilis]
MGAAALATLGWATLGWATLGWVTLGWVTLGWMHAGVDGRTPAVYTMNVILIVDNNTAWSMNTVRPAIELAMDDVNTRLLAGTGVRLNATFDCYSSEWLESKASSCEDTDCEARELVKALKANDQLGCVIVGPSCQYSSYSLLRSQSVFNRPVIAAGSFGLSTTYSAILSRTLVPATKISTMLTRLWAHTDARKQFAWRTAIVFTEGNNDANVCFWYLQALLENVQGPLGQNFMSLRGLLGKDHVLALDTFARFNTTLSGTRHSNVIIMCASLTRAEEVIKGLGHLSADTREQLVFVVIDLFGLDYYKTYENHSSALERALIVTLPERQATAFGEKFNLTSNHFVVGYYDSVLLYGSVLRRGLEQGSYSCSSADAHSFRNLHFQGLEEEIYLDENGDRDTNIKILSLRGNKFEEVWDYSTGLGTFLLAENVTLPWLGNQLPDDTPNSPKMMEVVKIALVAVCSLLFLLFLGFIIMWRKYAVEKQLSRQRWVIPWSELQTLPDDEAHLTFEVRIEKLSVDGSHGPVPPCAPCFLKRKYDNKVVALKPLCLAEKDFSRPQKLELNNLVALDFENLVKFYGTTTDVGATYAVVEFCSRAALRDILDDDVAYPEETLMDWDFKVSLMQDIAKGMAYLHSSKITVHGRLKSTNCVVDGRMVVKITDFGLVSLRDDIRAPKNKVSMVSIGKDEPIIETQAKPSTVHALPPGTPRLWTAPELLPLRAGASQRGDVYSFGIVLQEILYRRQVFYIQGSSLTDKDIVEQLLGGKVLRPTLDMNYFIHKGGGEELCAMITDCWEEVPDKRPDFRKIEGILRRISMCIHKGKAESYVDSLIRRLEQYSKNLERLVEERTELYKRERDRADHLNYQLLPKTVVQALKSVGSVQPELFEEVTIYFSDIVGFTTICKHCEPMEVVCLLNDLYKEFDSIVDSHDVYKVETIGDAYMLVSGLPKRNGCHHAMEIANVALDILAFMGSFHIQHLPGLPVWVRIGIHSGKCAAGVVGNKMPRYCLFGDTVNTASRMESTGYPYRIHVSQSTVDTLNAQQSGHQFTCRGIVELKGRGLEVTYWLVGRKGFFKKLPEPPKAASAHGLREEFERMIVDVKRRGVGERLCPPDGGAAGSDVETEYWQIDSRVRLQCETRL